MTVCVSLNRRTRDVPKKCSLQIEVAVKDLVYKMISLYNFINYSQGMLYIGIVIVFNSRIEQFLKNDTLKFHHFGISLVFHFWFLLETFLIVVTLLYEIYVNNQLNLVDLIILFRILTIIAALVRLRHLSMISKKTII